MHDEQDGTASYETKARRMYGGPVSAGAPIVLHTSARSIEHTSHRVALARIDRERRRLDLEEERILSRPDAPESTDGDGPIVYFRKTFGNATIPDGGGYQYTAVYVAGMQRWYLTGHHAPRDGMSWSALVEWAEKDEPSLPVIWVATDWRAINEPGLQD